MTPRTLALLTASAAALGLPGAALAAVDLSGFWILQSDPMAVPKAPATPAAAKRAKELLAARGPDAPAGSPEYSRLWCTTPGLPWQQTSTAPMSIAQSRSFIAITYSNKADPRDIYLDGQGHPGPDDFDAIPVGHGVGHWKGDTLLVDTRYFARGVTVIPGGAIRTGKSRLTERFSLAGKDTLRITSTWTDPTTLRRPHTYTYVYKRAAGPVWMTEPQCNPVKWMRAKGLHVPFDAVD